MRRSLVVVGAAGAVVLAACGSAASAHHAESPPTSPNSLPSASQPATPETAMTTVMTKDDPQLGPILASDGRTLYQFEKDQGTTTACTGACTNVWPALMATGTPQAAPGINPAQLSSAHGQVTYAGHLLYFFSGDHAPGDTNGLGIPDWSAVSPTGERVSSMPDHT